MKKIISLSLAFFAFASFSVFAFAFKNEVCDYASLFSEDEYSEIVLQAHDYSAATDISLSVLTIDYAQGLSSEEYANDYIDNLIDGEGWNEDCMLFMIDMDNRNVWISTTGRAENIYYDVDSVIDGGYDYLVNGEYGQCILGMIETATDIYSSYGYSSDDYYGGYHDDGYYGDYEYDYGYDYDGYSDYQSNDSVSITDILVYIIVGLGIGGISVFAVKSRYKNFGKGDEFDTDDVFLNLTGSNDTVISRNVITTKIPRNNNNHHRTGGGGFSGGARPSGGGRSHGGGGRGF